MNNRNKAGTFNRHIVEPHNWVKNVDWIRDWVRFDIPFHCLNFETVNKVRFGLKNMNWQDLLQELWSQTFWEIWWSMTHLTVCPSGREHAPRLVYKMGIDCHTCMLLWCMSLLVVESGSWGWFQSHPMKSQNLAGLGRSHLKRAWVRTCRRDDMQSLELAVLVSLNDESIHRINT